MWPIYEGWTCVPSSTDAMNCMLGGYPSYVVNVSTVAQIQLAVNFARGNSLRLVVKNTGHDYLGKSVGAGALGIWTHRLKELQYLEGYESKRYRGAAVKMGAGIQGEELYRKAKEVGFTPVAVGGEGPVGFIPVLFRCAGLTGADGWRGRWLCARRWPFAHIQQVRTVCRPSACSASRPSQRVLRHGD